MLVVGYEQINILTLLEYYKCPIRVVTYSEQMTNISTHIYFFFGMFCSLKGKHVFHYLSKQEIYRTLYKVYINIQ